ncbi:hypothetical protein D3C74_403160 [compost metagenome]
MCPKIALLKAGASVEPLYSPGCYVVLNVEGAPVWPKDKSGMVQDTIFIIFVRLTNLKG